MNNNNNITQSTYSEDYGVKSLVDEEDHDEQFMQSSNISKNKSILNSNGSVIVDKEKPIKKKNDIDNHNTSFHSKIPRTLKPLITKGIPTLSSTSSLKAATITATLPSTRKKIILSEDFDKNTNMGNIDKNDGDDNKDEEEDDDGYSCLSIDHHEHNQHKQFVIPNVNTNFPNINYTTTSSPTSRSSDSPDINKNNNNKSNDNNSRSSTSSNNDIHSGHENINSKLTSKSYPSSPTSSSSLSSSPVSSPMPKNNSNNTFQLRQSSMIKDIGHLRIIICGDSGIGKSSLLQAFKIFPEIMIMNDDLTTILNNQLKKNESQEIEENDKKNQIEEFYFSTTIIPNWQDEYQSIMEDLKTNEKDEGDTDDNAQHVIAANNICLIDTPGYGASIDAKSVIQYIKNYLERQFQITNQLFSPILPNSSQMKKLLMNSKGGHTHVDACLYLILDRLKPVDIEFLRSIHHLCNIIPIIVKSDLLSREQEQNLRYSVLKELIQNDINIFKCNYTYDQLLDMCIEGITSTIPFSISTKSTTSAPSSLSSFQQQQRKINHHDQRFYTASAYSKLTQLKDILFYTQLDHLRYSTANKFLQWRRQQTNIISATTSLSSISPLYSSILSSPSTATTSTSSLFSSIPQPMTPISLINSSFSISHHHHHQQQLQEQEQQNYTKMKQETLMIDLENLSYQLTTREISERIQELRKRQSKNINLKIKEYMKLEQEKLDKKAQEDMIMLKRKYNQWGQQQKADFLIKEMEILISLNPPNIIINQQDKKKYMDGIKYLRQVQFSPNNNNNDYYHHHPFKKLLRFVSFTLFHPYTLIFCIILIYLGFHYKYFIINY